MELVTGDVEWKFGAAEQPANSNTHEAGKRE
jgi:hypothetical protein